MITLDDIASVIVICIIYGYFYGVFVALATPLVIVLTPDLSELGARMGISLAFVALGGLLGGPISGALLSSQYVWLIPSLFSGVIGLAGSLVFVVVRLMIYHREKRKT